MRPKRIGNRSKVSRSVRSRQGEPTAQLEVDVEEPETISKTDRRQMSRVYRN